MATTSRRRSHPARVALPRMEGFDREQFERQFKAPCRPVLMKGAAASWPAVSSWTPEHLAARFEDLAVMPSVDLPDTEVPYRYRDRDFRQSMTLGELVQQLKSGKRCYVDQMSIDHYEGLDADFDFGTFRPDDVKVIALWMGARTCSGLHYDWVDNLFVQVYGTKKVILAAPGEVRHLYPFPDSHTKSQVAPEHPDLAAFPRFRHATLLEGIVEPGDVLFIPKGWWHYLASADVSISLTCWYGSSRTPLHELEVLLQMRSPSMWAKLVRDFVWYGVLQRPCQNRLYSLPPTGMLLYQLVEGYVASLRRPRPGA